MGIEILAYHGWAYDATFWDPLCLHLPDEIRFKAADRGYFGHASEAAFSGEEHKIIFAHSLGLHLIPEEQLYQAEILVLFASFDHFIPPDKDQARLVKRLLHRMKEKLPVNPQSVIQDFRSRAEAPFQADFFGQNLNTGLLISDLKMLQESRINLAEVTQAQILLIEGGQDQIFNSPHMKAYKSDCIDYYRIPEAGHAFPFTHPAECFSIIKQAIPILGHHE